MTDWKRKMCESNSRVCFKARTEDSGKRLDALIGERSGEISRSFAAKLIESGDVTVNGRTEASKKYKVDDGDEISVIVPEPESLSAEPENIPLDIAYEDADLLVVNKPRGMVVHPAPGNYSGTLVNALMYHCGDNLSAINGVLRPGIVHRIDKDTSGLLVVAKSDRAHESLSRQLSEHTVTRRYTALVYNNIKEDQGTVDAPIGRDPADRFKRAVTDRNGKRAVTHWEVLERFGRFTLIEARLETGRTHQIRVHMSYIKHPLAGDPLYGPKKQSIPVSGQLLHAGILGFRHPADERYMEFKAELPDEFRKVLEELRRRYGKGHS